MDHGIFLIFNYLNLYFFFFFLAALLGKGESKNGINFRGETITRQNSEGGDVTRAATA